MRYPELRPGAIVPLEHPKHGRQLGKFVKRTASRTYLDLPDGTRIALSMNTTPLLKEAGAGKGNLYCWRYDR